LRHAHTLLPLLEMHPTQWMCAPGIVMTLALVAPAHAQENPDTASHPELARLYLEDQADRNPPATAPSDFFDGMEARDRARRNRVMALYNGDQLRTGSDYFHAAVILQHGDTPEDYLLAHELSVVALTLGEARAEWWAAATLDRFLVSIGRPQRFGTQSHFDPTEQAYRMQPVEPGVTDVVRQLLGVPIMEEAQARVAELNRQIKQRLQSTPGS
jgi:hypothetical protein